MSGENGAGLAGQRVSRIGLMLGMRDADERSSKDGDGRVQAAQHVLESVTRRGYPRLVTPYKYQLWGNILAAFTPCVIKYVI